MQGRVRSIFRLGMVVERGDKRCRLDFADEVDWGTGICFGASEETGRGGSGWREGLLWIDIKTALSRSGCDLLHGLRAWIRGGENRDVRMHDSCLK